ncbi:hypothetical protein SUGI_0295490 [Cryptomeria japonica]|nr:hypothetical protein SUGI_0295490 [Cryptomeria japonica]
MWRQGKKGMWKQLIFDIFGEDSSPKGSLAFPNNISIKGGFFNTKMTSRAEVEVSWRNGEVKRPKAPGTLPRDANVAGRTIDRQRISFPEDILNSQIDDLLNRALIGKLVRVCRDQGSLAEWCLMSRNGGEVMKGKTIPMSVEGKDGTRDPTGFGHDLGMDKISDQGNQEREASCNEVVQIEFDRVGFNSSE